MISKQITRELMVFGDQEFVGGESYLWLQLDVES